MRENDCEERAGMKTVSVLKGEVDEAGQQQQQQQRELTSLNNSVDVYSVLLTKKCLQFDFSYLLSFLYEFVCFYASKIITRSRLRAALATSHAFIFAHVP